MPFPPVSVYAPGFRNVPRLSSSNACWSCSCVFITMGPYHATGSPNGFPDDQEEPDPFVPGLHRNLVSAVKEHERAVFRLRGRRRVRPADPFGRHRQRLGRVAELTGSAEDVRKGVPGHLDRQRPSPARRHRYIQVDRIGRDTVHGAALAPETAADNANPGPVIVRDYGDCRPISPPGNGAPSS